MENWVWISFSIYFGINIILLITALLNKEYLNPLDAFGFVFLAAPALIIILIMIAAVKVEKNPHKKGKASC